MILQYDSGLYHIFYIFTHVKLYLAKTAHKTFDMSIISCYDAMILELNIKIYALGSYYLAF